VFSVLINTVSLADRLTCLPTVGTVAWRSPSVRLTCQVKHVYTVVVRRIRNMTERLSVYLISPHFTLHTLITLITAGVFTHSGINPLMPTVVIWVQL